MHQLEIAQTAEQLLAVVTPTDGSFFIKYKYALELQVGPALSLWLSHFANATWPLYGSPWLSFGGEETDQYSKAIMGNSLLLFHLTLIDAEFPGEQLIHAQKRVLHILSAKAGWQAQWTPHLSPGIVMKFHTGKPQGANFSPAALSEQMQSNSSRHTGRFLPLIQAVRPAHCWQRLLDDRHQTDICMCLDSDIHQQTQSITLNTLPDLFLHIQACCILQPAHQMLSG